jgi:hypothetical protein
MPLITMAASMARKESNFFVDFSSKRTHVIGVPGYAGQPEVTIGTLLLPFRSQRDDWRESRHQRPSGCTDSVC